MKKNTVKALLICTVTSLLSSCGGENIHDLDKPGEAVAIQAEILEEAGDLMTYEITMTSQGDLSTSLDYITVVSEKDETSVSETSFRIIGSGETTTDVEDNGSRVKNYIEDGSKKLSEIDFELVQSNFEEAKKTIPAEYHKHALQTYKIQFKDGKRADIFYINCLLKDESDHFEGGDLVTNYYEFIVSMQEDGSLLYE